MITEKKTALLPILESTEGIHLTAYLVNRGNLADLKVQLRGVLNEAYEWLHGVQTAEEQKKFLEPLESLLNDARIFKQMKGNIGLFRNKDLFRVLNIPVDVEHSCQVATSFHVKPLLRWMQMDRDFLLLGLEKDSAYLYLGSQDSLKLIDAISFPEFFKEKDFLDGYVGLNESGRRKVKQEETYVWLNEWIEQLTRNSKPKLFVAGEKSQVDIFNRNLKYFQAVKSPIANAFSRDSVGEICSSIRKIMKDESRKSLERSLLEFRFAEEGNRTKKNIFQIAKAVVQGKVRKLIVTDDLNIFGRIDPDSGGLAIHPFDLDHEDDDILDDLAQMVLSQGGEVIVAKRDEIPKGRPILALLDDEGEELGKTEELQERFG